MIHEQLCLLVQPRFALGVDSMLEGEEADLIAFQLKIDPFGYLLVVINFVLIVLVFGPVLLLVFFRNFVNF